MNFEDNVKNGVLFGFIPHQLEITERPELSVFPFNVMFAKYKTEAGKTIMGSAVYEPDLASLKQEKDKWSMCYHNAYLGKSRLSIEYDLIKKSYLGKKFVNDALVGSAIGAEWKMFFVHFTALGLSNGEKCEFKTVD